MVEEEGSRGYLFLPNAQAPSKAALAYIAQGEEADVHTAYKCRVRTPWWRVPVTPVADLLFTYMNHDAPRLVANRAGVHHLNSIHGVVLKPERRKLGMDLLPLATLNSATLLSAELVGRSYGGGILKLEPKEAHIMAVPALGTVPRRERIAAALRQPVARLLAESRLVDAVAAVDQVLLTEQLGLTRAEVASLAHRARRCSTRRQARKG